jgi:hypothetical protein
MNIPRGYWHRATRADLGEEGYSLHATFGFTKRTGVDWLTWLSDNARADERFRTDLSRFASADLRYRQFDELAAAVAELVKTYPVEDFLTERERERRVWRHVDTKSIFGAPTAVVCMTEFPPHLEHRDGRVVVTAAAKEIEFAERALPALRPLLSGAPADLGEVTAKTGVDAEALATRLIEEDMCAELTPELLSGYTGLVTSATSW